MATRTSEKTIKQGKHRITTSEEINWPGERRNNLSNIAHGASPALLSARAPGAIPASQQPIQRLLIVSSRPGRPLCSRRRDQQLVARARLYFSRAQAKMVILPVA